MYQDPNTQEPSQTSKHKIVHRSGGRGRGNTT